MLRWGVLCVPVALISSVAAQSLSCAASANPPVVRAEGITERTGDILLSCSGGQPNATISGNLTAYLDVNVTNRIAADGSMDVLLTVNNQPSNVPAKQYAQNAVVWNGLSFQLSATGAVELRIANLRGNASQKMLAPNAFLNSFVSFNGSSSGGVISFTATSFIVGAPQPGLLAGQSGQLICAQTGSPLPDTISFSNLIGKGTAFASTRVTEGFANAFAPKSDWSNLRADSGVRVMLNYSGFAAGSRLFVPDAVAGIDADQPTSAGDLGLPVSGGAYTPGKGQLLLLRVFGTDASGAGGFVSQIPAVSTAFDSASEVTLSGGAGVAVYEMVDASPTVRESAQIPTFLGFPGSGSGGAVITNTTVNLAPASNMITAATSAPIPRFNPTAPPTDCSAVNDCSANYFPKLLVVAPPIAFTGVAGSTPPSQAVPVRNDGSGIMQWSATVAYANGSNWLRLLPSSGVNNGTVRVDALTAGLQPGTYQATITIDAGPLAGMRSVPVTLQVMAPPPPRPTVQTVGNAADGTVAALAPGSLASVFGTNFGGQTVQVTFDGSAAKVLYSNGTQINLQVPSALAGKSTAQMIVSVDGNAGAPVTVKVAVSAPAIFPGAVLNEDYSVNGASSAAKVGSIVQIFATGLPSSGILTAKIHDRTVNAPYYAGPAPGLPGVQQVDVVVPADFPTMQTYIFVCGGPTLDQQVCSAPAKIWVTQ
jgi:uncharacterized protein (TIGR03437 family)